MKVVMTLVTVILTFMTPPVAEAQTTLFTYQGQLTDSGTPQATYQMRFRLFDALASGSQVGGTIENASVGFLNKTDLPVVSPLDYVDG